MVAFVWGALQYRILSYVYSLNCSMWFFRWEDILLGSWSLLWFPRKSWSRLFEVKDTLQDSSSKIFLFWIFGSFFSKPFWFMETQIRIKCLQNIYISIWHETGIMLLLSYQNLLIPRIQQKLILSPLVYNLPEFPPLVSDY